MVGRDRRVACAAVHEVYTMKDIMPQYVIEKLWEVTGMLLGNFTGQISIDSLLNSQFKIALRSPGAPGNLPYRLTGSPIIIGLQQ